MDTKPKELSAEERISSELLQAGMLVAKPKFDSKGTDLLVFAEMKDGVKFCRIQCKFRSLNNGRAHVEIPFEYVTDGFVLFLLISEGQSRNLYCFFPWEIRRWRRPNDEYSLTISATKYETDLSSCLFDETRSQMIRHLIRSAETSGEFRRLVPGRGQVILGSVQAKGVGFCHGGTNPEPPLDRYPLLAWMHTGHHKHGLSVFTEDQKASVNEIATAFSVMLSPEALAAEFGTTIGHVSEAIKYAREAGLLEINVNQVRSGGAVRKKRTR